MNEKDPRVTIFLAGGQCLNCPKHCLFHPKGSIDFSNRHNLQLFIANPGKYAPQYGGYCAYGISQGHKAPTEIATWTILNDKLYFNYNQKVKEVWAKDQPGYIQKADQQWKDIKGKE